MRFFSYAVFLLLFLTISAFAQTPSATPPEAEEILKISTSLIQIDVTVTDKKGNIVRNLNPDDFEVYENGKKQNISNFSFVSSESTSDSTAAEESPARQTKKNNSVPIPPVKLKSEQVRRTYALVVDDLGLSFDNVPAVRQSLKKFVNEQIAEGDLVAVIRTGSGIGALQSFTTDKRQLLAAIEKIRWNPQGRGGISSFAAISPTFKEQLSGENGDGKTKSVAGQKEDEEFQNQINEFRTENFSAGTMGALNYVIRGMKQLPGRKSVILFSEGFQMLKNEGGMLTVSRTMQNLRVLADVANRASVVFYTIDPRGLTMPDMLFAEDNTYGLNGEAVRQRQESRYDSFIDSQQSLRYLAYETGGLPFVNQNNFNLGLQRAIDDQKGYYLIGYEPDEATFDPKKSKFNKLTVKLKREDLRVRYRSGFFGISDQRLAAEKQTPQQQIYNALTSPFGTSGISLNLTSLFADDPKTGAFVRSLVNINAKDLKFSTEPDGTHKASFDILAMTFGDNGAPVEEAAKNYTIRVGEKVYQKILDKGFIYNLLVPIKKPGAYQFRVALRDSASAKVGSASQFIEVPNLRSGKLALSDIALNNYETDEWHKISLGQNPGSTSEANSDINTSLRSFRNGTVLRYDYVIYNAKISPGNLQIQARLFRDGQMVVEGNPSAFDASGQTDLKRLQAVGAITLGKNLKPGNYVLQIIASDGAPDEKNRLATRWVDFEITE